MLLTRQSQIAINLLVTCAHAEGRYVHTHDAASGTGASKEHAAKVAHILRRAGFVKSVRGRRGGIALARPARCISIGEVLRHTQPDIGRRDRREAMLGPSGAVLVGVIEAGWTNFVDLMNRFTIADLIADHAPQRLTCQSCTLTKGEPMLQVAAPLSVAIEGRDVHALPAHG